MPKDKATGKKLADMMYGDPNRPAFGVYPMIAKRREDRQDREAAKNFPVDLGRGAFAGAAGLAGDIESLGRLPYVLYTGNESPTFLPTSEEILKRLPYGTETPVGQFASGLGTLAGGSVPFGAIPKAIKTGAKGVMAAGRAGERMAEKYVPQIMERGGAGADILSGMAQGSQSRVIKGPGGNWLAGRGSPESALQLLKGAPISDDQLKGLLKASKNEKASPATRDEMRQAYEQAAKEQALDKWVSSNLTNYVKKQMATPDDPVRKLAEEGITHKPSMVLDEPAYVDMDTMAQREKAGFPAEGVGRSELAKAWERVSDEAMVVDKAGDIQGAPQRAAKTEEARRKMREAQDDLDVKLIKILREKGLKENEVEALQKGMPYKEKAAITGDTEFEKSYLDYMTKRGSMDESQTRAALENPWIEKVAPETPVYQTFTGDLGFDHIMDVLREDVASGRIRPEQLNKVSMEQAVRRTYEYDQEMARKMAETQLRATEGMPTYKDYPEKGYKWIELAAPKLTELPKGYSIKEANGSPYLVNPEGGTTSYLNADDPMSHALKIIGEKQLADALKYEGETMGHCVGGYCPDVLSGDKRIFSLRNIKTGEPHTTIETTPYPKHDSDYVFYELSDKLGRHPTQQEWDAGMAAKEPKIVQIKGKQNLAPKEEYQPFVQDFVRSGKWSDVGDLRNTGLTRKSDLIDKFSPDELDSIGAGEYLTKAEQDELLYKSLNKSRPGLTDELGLTHPPEDGMAKGGRVQFSDNPDTMALELAGGGKVGFLTEGIKAAAKAIKPAKEAAVPLQVPRARPTPKEILDAAERVGRQQAGEFVTNPLTGKTTNLAGRSKKEVERLKNMEYKVTPIKDLPEMKPYEAKVGEVNIAVPGDQTISDMLLESVDGMPIGTTSEGGALFGRGRLSDPEDTRAFWASNIGPAELFQKKVTELARLYNTDEVTAYHLAMGSMSNNFAQHLADASMRATDYSKLSAPKMKAFDRVMREGYVDPVSKERVAFPNWPGIAFPEESLQVMKEDPLLRKWYSNRMKTPKITGPLDLPNTKSIEYAMTEPAIRDMEINLTGLSAGRMRPEAELVPGSSHNTYSHDILGTALGRAPELAPFSISFPDVTSFVREKYRPQDFTGTIQKVFPHQVVDEAYLEDMQKYYEQLRKVRGYQEGGAVTSPAAKIDGNNFVLAAKKYGLDDSPRTLNKLVSLVNQGATVDEAARIVSDSTVRISDNPDVMALELSGGGKVGAITGAIKGFFSAVDKAAEKLKRPAGTGKEFMAEVKATPGVKPTELKARSLTDIEAMPKMSKAQFLKELEARPPVKIEEKVFGEPSQKDIDKLADKLAYEKGRNEAYEFSNRGDDIEAMTEENYRLSLKHDWDDLQEQAREALQEGKDSAYHQKYTIPGGENYREILLKMPPQLEKGYKTPNGEFFTEERLADPVVRQAAEQVGLTPATRKVGKEYPGVPQHFGGEPNILASIRVSDRMVPTYTPEQAESIGQRIAQGINVADPKNLASGAPEMAVKRGIVTPLEAAQYSDYRGYKNNDLAGAREKVLHVEEIQSDWHQAGRKARTDEIKRLVDSGMSKQEAQAAVPEDFGYSSNMAARRQELGDRYKRGELSLDQYDYLDRELASVPDAPFKKDWQELALRKVMELASEGGYDRVALTKGAEQASRYDLSQHVDEIAYNPINGYFAVRTAGQSAADVSRLTPDELVSHIGQEAADKLMQAPASNIGLHVLSGEDLKVGGKGMESFYDKMLPDYLNKMGKQYGVQVGEINIPTPQNKTPASGEDMARAMGMSWEDFSRNRDVLEKEFWKMQQAKTTPVHGFTITPEMRQDIAEKGQPLYSKIGIPGAEAAGAATIGTQVFDGNTEQQVQNPIQFTENPDAMRLELMQRN